MGNPNKGEVDDLRRRISEQEARIKANLRASILGTTPTSKLSPPAPQGTTTPPTVPTPKLSPPSPSPALPDGPPEPPHRALLLAANARHAAETADRLGRILEETSALLAQSGLAVRGSVEILTDDDIFTKWELAYQRENELWGLYIVERTLVGDGVWTQNTKPQPIAKASRRLRTMAAQNLDQLLTQLEDELAAQQEQMDRGLERLGVGGGE